MRVDLTLTSRHENTTKNSSSHFVLFMLFVLSCFGRLLSFLNPADSWFLDQSGFPFYANPANGIFAALRSAFSDDGMQNTIQFSRGQGGIYGKGEGTFPAPLGERIARPVQQSMQRHKNGTVAADPELPETLCPGLRIAARIDYVSKKDMPGILHRQSDIQGQQCLPVRGGDFAAAAGKTLQLF